MTDDELPDISASDVGPRRFPDRDEGEFWRQGSLVFRPAPGADQSPRVTDHELNHFWVHCSTPYGLFLDELTQLQTSDMIQYCVYGQCGRRAPIPAMRALQQLSRDEQQSGLAESAALQHFAKRWLRCFFLEQVLEGADTRGVRHAKLSQVLRWLSEIERTCIESGPADLLPDDIPPISDYQRRLLQVWAAFHADHPRSACPPIGHSGDRRPFGGQHLFESYAKSVESPAAGGKPPAKTIDELMYYGAIASAARVFGKERLQNEHELQIFFTTIPVLFDLALYVPLGAVYGRFREDQMTWRDVHPGYRFKRLLARMEDADWIADLEGDAVPLQSLLTMRLRWPHPEKFLNLGAQLCDKAPYGRHAAACAIRLERADRGIMWRGSADLAVEPLIESHPPMQVIAGSTLVVPGATVHAKLLLVLGYALHRLAYMVMVGGSIDLWDLAPPGIGNSTTLDTTEKGFVETLLSALPFADPGRFRSV